MIRLYQLQSAKRKMSTDGRRETVLCDLITCKDTDTFPTRGEIQRTRQLHHHDQMSKILRVSLHHENESNSTFAWCKLGEPVNRG